MHFQSDICVVGNGAIGKVAALAFAQAGQSVTLLAPVAQSVKDVLAAEASWDVRVFALNHVAHQLLSSLRVWDAMDFGRIATVDAMEVTGDGVQGAGYLTFDAYGARTSALAWIVEDSNLNQALDAALRFASNVKLVNARATRLRLDETSANVELDNGDTLGASLLVGADGGQSWIRGQCDIGLDYRPYGQRGVVTNFECEKPHRGVAHQWFTSHEGIIALLPLPGQRVSLVWSAPDALADTLLHMPLDELAQRVSQFCSDSLGQLRPIYPQCVKAFPLILLRPHAITGTRVAFVGDAAHVVHPLAGHGMNLGFADVAALLKQVVERESYRDCGDARILSRYARARKEEILLMQMATDGLERLFAAEFEPIRFVRNVGMSMLNNLPFIKRRLISHALGK